MKVPERPCSIKRQQTSSRNVLQRPVEPAAISGHFIAPGAPSFATGPSWSEFRTIRKIATSARGTIACHFPRFRSLKAFGRRPRCKPHRRDRPASETLNKTRRSHADEERSFSVLPPDAMRFRLLCFPSEPRGRGAADREQQQQDDRTVAAPRLPVHGA